MGIPGGNGTERALIGGTQPGGFRTLPRHPGPRRLLSLVLGEWYKLRAARQRASTFWGDLWMALGNCYIHSCYDEG